MCGFCNVCVCVGFVMCGCVCMCGFCNVCVCVCVDFVMCVCFGNTCTCIYCVFVLFRLYLFCFMLFFNSVNYVFFVMFIYSYCSVHTVYIVPNWHSSATLTKVFPCFFLSCKTNARI